MVPAALLIPFDSMGALVALVFSYAVFPTIGFPAIATLRRFGKLNIFSLVFVGGIIGAISFLGLSYWFAKVLDSTGSSALQLKTISWGFFLGALSAGTFGVIVGLQSLRAGRAA
jgi:hypothetical protein